ANQEVTLERRRRGGAFAAFREVQTDGSGRFSLRIKMKGTSTYRAHVAETVACLPDHSGATTVKRKKK
ncbi:MAG TPA: hypothetical protein VF052_09135, partial [Solirubrobacterales bacterium]